MKRLLLAVTLGQTADEKENTPVPERIPEVRNWGLHISGACKAMEDQHIRTPVLLELIRHQGAKVLGQELWKLRVNGWESNEIQQTQSSKPHQLTLQQVRGKETFPSWVNLETFSAIE